MLSFCCSSWSASSWPTFGPASVFCLASICCSISWAICSCALVELLGLVAHVAHLVGELAGGPPLQLLAHLLELPLGARGAGLRLGKPALLHRLGRVADLRPGVIEPLAGVGHPLAVLGAVHLLADLIRVAQGLKLLIPQALELAERVLPLLLVAGLAQGGLGLAEFVAHLALAARRSRSRLSISKSFRWLSC